MNNETTNQLSVACIIPTYNGKNDLLRLLASLQAQKCKFDVIVVDSGSVDGTFDVIQDYYDKGVVSRFSVIDPATFNHGGTRSTIATDNPAYDVFIYLTQDAYLEGTDSIANIVKYFTDETVGAVCGRQLPHHDATLLSQHARLFNYPDSVVVKALADASVYGLKTVFMSNSFSAYRKDAFFEAGGFPDDVILSEDMFLGAKIVLNNWKLVYAGDAVCRHSHNYTLKQEFKRYFDIGVFQSRAAWISERFGGASGEGIKYVLSELKYIGVRRIYLWPSSLLRNFLKIVGYKLGKFERYLPIKLKKKISMHHRFWDSVHAESK